MKRRLSCCVVVIISLASSSGCTGGSDLKWKEDVKLPDGRVVTLSRYVEFKGPTGGMGSTPTESHQIFTFDHPTTGERIRWENTFDQGIVRTVALWIDGEKPVLLTEPAYGNDLFKFKCPNPPYLLFEYVTGHWRHTPLSLVKLRTVRSNITSDPLGTRRFIESSNKRLGIEHTSQTYAYYKGIRKVPYVITFEQMPQQTFESRNCDRPLNYLIPIQRD